MVERDCAPADLARLAAQKVARWFVRMIHAPWITYSVVLSNVVSKSVWSAKPQPRGVGS